MPHVRAIPAAGRLAAALERVPFALLVAPAGSGKTTVLAAWARAESRWHPVWVRLEAQDDDVMTLARAIGAGLRASFDRGSTRLEQILSSPSGTDIRHIARAVALDLDEVGDVVLVLDDLHHLRSDTSLELVEALLDDLGPTSRLVSASRVEPPFRLPLRRVRRQVVELTAADLLLDQGQVEGLLADASEQRHGLAELILRRSAGWATAAVLMAARVNAGADAGTGVMCGTALESSEADIDAFLRAEIIDQLDPELQRFVLETSLLDTLDVAACEAVAETGRSSELLAQARRRGLVEPIGSRTADGGSGMTLRYHDRIAAFLRAELAARTKPARLTELRRRAAAVSSPMRAIDLLLDAGDVAAAAAAVVMVGRALVETPGGRVPRTWLARFDEDQLNSEPWLALLAGLASIEDGAMGTASRRLAPVVEAMREREDWVGLLLSAYGLAEAHLARGEVEAAAALINGLLDLDTTPDQRVKVLLLKLWLDYFRTDWEAVGAGLDEAFALAFTGCSELGRSTVALGLGTEFLFAPRGSSWLLDRCVELRLRIRRDAMAIASLEVMQAAAHLIEGRLRRAEELAAGIDERTLELGSLSWLATAADRIRLGLALTAGDHGLIDTIVAAARHVVGDSDRHHQERAMYAYAIARSGWLSRTPERVRSALVLLGKVAPEDRPDTAVTGAIISSMIHRDEGDPVAAEGALLAVRGTHHAVRFCLVTGLVDLELAGLLLTQGRKADAIEIARPTLSMLAELDGVGLLALDGADTHRALLDACRDDPELGAFAGRALKHLARPAATAGIVIPNTSERLSPRELDVLRLVMSGRSNREIAEELYIGERTVKSHMTSLMTKLDVTSRTAAIRRAHELGIS